MWDRWVRLFILKAVLLSENSGASKAQRRLGTMNGLLSIRRIEKMSCYSKRRRMIDLGIDNYDTRLDFKFIEAAFYSHLVGTKSKHIPAQYINLTYDLI